MAYYHVLLTPAGSPARTRCLLEDLSEQTLLARFVQPYRGGKTIACGDEVITAPCPEQVRILRTETAANPSFANSSLQGRADPQKVIAAGEDVTAFYLGKPSGFFRGLAILSELHFRIGWT